MYKVVFYRKKTIYKNNKKIDWWQNSRLLSVRFEREFNTLSELAKFMAKSRHFITIIPELTSQELLILNQKLRSLTNGDLIQTGSNRFEYIK